MDQMHKRFTAEQIKVLLKGYCQGMLNISNRVDFGDQQTTFFLTLKEYRNLDEFSLAYCWEAPTSIPALLEKEIEKGLMLEREVNRHLRCPYCPKGKSEFR